MLSDIHADEAATPQRVEGLLELAPGAPAILVSDVYGQAAWEPLRPRLAALLHRPITIGHVVAAVRRILPLEQ
jgi:hypothetical protein